ncbi:MAG: YfhO family protein, partial [Anaerolineae bacterium]|nr:YfhO family protein [Anaerolineae bacterium]
DHTVALDVLNSEAVFPPITIQALRISSFTEQADAFGDGTIVGEVVIRQRDGQIEKFPLRLGIETADWDYDRKKALHRRATIARSFPAFWRAFGRMFEGHTYLVQYDTNSPREITGISVHALIPQVRLTIEAVMLKDTQGQWISLASLTGKNDFSLAYMSDTVAVWENHNVLPRAFFVPCAQVLNDDASLARLRDPKFDPQREVLLVDALSLRPSAACVPTGQVEITNYQPERVEIRATTDQPGYLVLTDSWYPGWEARVNGQPAPIYRANLIFRAVPIEAGTHTITFEYRPRSLVLGASISAMSLLLVLGISFWRLRKIR